MNEGAPPFNAQERDIDLMLLEEMHCNPAFLAWIAEHAGISEAALFSAQHSVYRGNGETDVLVLIDTPDGRVALMIEDKIGAGMQPRQAERYHERGIQLCADDSIKRYRTLLCAPSNYIAGVPAADWHATLSFESIADWFDKEDDPRAHWRRDTLMRAARRQRRSMAGLPGNDLVVADATLVRFKLDYRDYVAQNHREFVLTVQTGRDKEYFFKESSFPVSIRLKHSFTASTMVLVFEQNWKEKAQEVLSGKITEGIWINIHNGALHLITGVEPIDLTELALNQTDLIDAAMDAARRLLPFATMVQQQR